MSINREKLRQHFVREYQQLNERQQLAVDTTEGAVMVIAGPGTDKTQILAARIGKILLDTDASPENILYLTYTEAGTIAMRRRLQGLIGPDAYKVNIHTFHSFCNDIVQENLSLFEKTALDPISDLERIQLFKTLIDGFPKNHPLKRYRGDVYFEMWNLQNLFCTMKREGWTPEFIHKKIDEYLLDLPRRDEYLAKSATQEFKKGDIRTDKIAGEKEHMDKLKAAVGEFDRFQKLMRDRDRYDFDDMINWVIRAFEENRPLLLSYQERYQYILVDEYQDTSGTQNRLISLLISSRDKPTLFVAGDDDLAAQIPCLSKHFVASHPRTGQMHFPPQLHEYLSPRQEMTGISLHVEKLLAEGVLPGRIAIIYKENKYGEELSRFLGLKNIPVYSKRDLDLFTVPLVQQVLLLLRYLWAEHDAPYGGDEMLFEILHFKFFGIAPIEIAKLSIEVADKQFGDQRTSIRRLLSEKTNRPARDLFDQGLPEPLKRASRALEQLIGDVSNFTLQGLFENLIRETGVLAFIMTNPEKVWLRQVLTALFDFIKEESRREPDLDLERLIQSLDLMKSNGLPLPLVKISGNDKAVNLLTPRGSKGLEFEYVFFAGANAGAWEKKRQPGGGYKYPDNLFPSGAGDESGSEELRRLFHVALTRVEVHLWISYARYRDDGKELEPSIFIAGIMDQYELPMQKISIPVEEQTAFDALPFTDAIAPGIQAAEEDLIGRKLEKFVMSVTALNNYLHCPLEFYYRNMVRIPSPRNEAAEFGSAVHHALQRLFEKMKDDALQRFPSRADMLADFEKYMRRHREIFTREAFTRRMDYGLEVLANYYDNYMTQWNKIVAVERNIRNVIVKGVPLKGKLDKLEFQGKEVNVVDYKTGDVDKAREKLAPPGEKNPNGGDYWRQAVFYKILVDSYEQKEWRVTSTEFDFVEPDKKKEYRKARIMITPEDTTTVTQQIVDTWHKIQNRDFYTGCGKPDCHWCNFVKSNDLAVAPN